MGIVRGGESMKVNIILYDSLSYEEIQLESMEDLKSLDTGDKNIWVDIVGLEDTGSLRELSDYFGINSLITRDILGGDLLSKYENFNDYLYIAFGITNLEIEEFRDLETINLSFVLYSDKLITFRPRELKVIDEIKDMVRNSNNPKLDNNNYLLFVIIDEVLDRYYDILEKIGEYIDELEDQLLVNPNKEILQDVYELKRNFIFIRKSLWAIRNMLNSISMGDELLDDRSIYYVRAIYNDVIQIIDLVETYREICSGMLDTYLSSIGNKTNDVMKILTIVSTIFIPISFYSNLFMMNMKNIWSYIIFWGLSLSTSFLLLYYFRRKDWF